VYLFPVPIDRHRSVDDDEPAHTPTEDHAGVESQQATPRVPDEHGAAEPEMVHPSFEVGEVACDRAVAERRGGLEPPLLVSDARQSPAEWAAEAAEVVAQAGPSVEEHRRRSVSLDGTHQPWVLSVPRTEASHGILARSS